MAPHLPHGDITLEMGGDSHLSLHWVPGENMVGGATMPYFL